MIHSAFSFWQPGMTSRFTKFNLNTEEGHGFGDISAWEDTPTERAQGAKMKYVYN